MAHRLPLAILAAGTLLLAAAPAGADAGADCASSPTSQPSAACGSASTSFDLASIMAEIMQLQQQQEQTYWAEAQSQLSTSYTTLDAAQQAARPHEDAALAGSISSMAGAISQDPAGALMAHVPDGGPLSGALTTQPPGQRP